MAEVTVQISLRGVPPGSRRMRELADWIGRQNETDAETTGAWEMTHDWITYPRRRTAVLRSSIQRLISDESGGELAGKAQEVDNLQRLLTRIDEQDLRF